MTQKENLNHVDDPVTPAKDCKTAFAASPEPEEHSISDVFRLDTDPLYSIANNEDYQGPSLLDAAFFSFVTEQNEDVDWLLDTSTGQLSQRAQNGSTVDLWATQEANGSIQPDEHLSHDGIAGAGQQFFPPQFSQSNLSEERMPIIPSQPPPSWPTDPLSASLGHSTDIHAQIPPLNLQSLSRAEQVFDGYEGIERHAAHEKVLAEMFGLELAALLSPEARKSVPRDQCRFDGRPKITAILRAGPSLPFPLDSYGGPNEACRDSTKRLSFDSQAEKTFRPSAYDFPQGPDVLHSFSTACAQIVMKRPLEEPYLPPAKHRRLSPMQPNLYPPPMMQDSWVSSASCRLQKPCP